MLFFEKRGVPDVSIVADPDTGLSVYDSYGTGGWTVLGGTSAASPQWAGLIAIINSAKQTKLTNLNTLLYNVATTSYSTTLLKVQMVFVERFVKHKKDMIT